jgi:hypothetical protein
MSGVWHIALQLLGEQWLGAGLVEQQFDAQSPSPTHPVHTYSPAIIPHAHPHTPQFAVVVVSTALPPQQRAFESPAFQFVPSASATAASHVPALHFRTSWHASGAAPHCVPLAALGGAPHVPPPHTGAVWQASGAVPHTVPSFAGTGVHVPDMHTGVIAHMLEEVPHGVASASAAAGWHTPLMQTGAA